MRAAAVMSFLARLPFRRRWPPLPTPPPVGMPKDAFRQLKRPAEEIVADFAELYYQQPAYWRDTRWLGVHAVKSPLDLWIYQEILYETRPDLVVETGTYSGGSALYLATILDLLATGEVISIDRLPVRDSYPEHPRITYKGGRSSTDAAVVADVRQAAAGAERVMVVLDSAHDKDHVLAELELYGALVTVGCYLICEDTAINGRPIFHSHGPGPAEALGAFLARHSGDWQVDRTREKFLCTYNPGGFVRRIAR